MRLAILAAALAGLLVAPAVARSDGDVGEAERAFTDLRYEETRSLLDRAQRSGRLRRAELLTTLILRAKVACITEGPSAGALAFRKLLTIAPSFRLDPNASPVFTEPLENARSWLEANRALEAVHPKPSYAADSARLEIRVTVDHDSFDMASAAEATLSVPRQTVYAPIVDGQAVMTFALQADQRIGTYWLSIRDSDGNEIVPFGSPDEPLRFDVSSAPPLVGAAETAEAGWRFRDKLLLGVAVTSAALLLGAVGFDVAATTEFDALESSCAPGCTRSQASTFRSRRRNALLFYGAAAATGATGAALWVWD